MSFLFLYLIKKRYKMKWEIPIIYFSALYIDSFFSVDVTELIMHLFTVYFGWSKRLQWSVHLFFQNCLRHQYILLCWFWSDLELIEISVESFVKDVCPNQGLHYQSSNTFFELLHGKAFNCTKRNDFPRYETVSIAIKYVKYSNRPLVYRRYLRISKIFKKYKVKLSRKTIYLQILELQLSILTSIKFN